MLRLMVVTVAMRLMVAPMVSVMVMMVMMVMTIFSMLVMPAMTVVVPSMMTVAVVIVTALEVRQMITKILAVFFRQPVGKSESLGFPRCLIEGKRELEDVLSNSAVNAAEHVVARAAVQDVVPLHCDQAVIAVAPVQRVVTVTFESIVSRTAV